MTHSPSIFRKITIVSSLQQFRRGQILIPPMIAEVMEA